MNDEAEVLAISAAWDAALLSNDADAVAAFVTNDWVYVGPDGPTSRDDVVNWIATGRLVHHTMRTVGRPRCAARGDVVIVTAHKKSSGAWDGQAYTADEWITEVFVREDTGWRCVLSQKSPVGSR